MTRRRALVVVAAVAGAVALLRRRRAAAARVDVYYEDGSMISLERGTPQADRMLALAADGLGAARAA